MSKRTEYNKSKLSTLNADLPGSDGGDRKIRQNRSVVETINSHQPRNSKRSEPAPDVSGTSAQQDIGRNIVQNVVRNQKDSLPSSHDQNFASNKISINPNNLQENPRSHATIPEMVSSPNEGQILDGHSIMTSDHEIEDSYHDEGSKSAYVKNETKLARKANRSIDITNARGNKFDQRKGSKRSSSKGSVKSLNRQTNGNNQYSRDMYYPGIALAPLMSQKSAPATKKINRDNRKLSLPEIKRGQLKKTNSVSSYSGHEKKNGSNYSNKNLKNIPNKEIGQSFMSFNVNNSSAKNNASVPGHLKQSLNFTVNQTPKVRESFES